MKPSTNDNAPQTELAGRELAVLAEAVDTKNWLDDFAAAPTGVRKALALDHRVTDGLAMVSSAVPFSHFNMVLTLGCPAKVDDAAFDAIDRFYAQSPADKHWVIVNDFSEPADLAEQLARRGYVDAGAWDRIVLRGTRRDLWAPHAAGCEIVGQHNARDWSSFILDVYGMPPMIAEWLGALVGRPGWTHALRRKDGKADGPVVMARSLFQADGWAWLGIDAPVPGVMAPCYADDQAVAAALLIESERCGAHSFVSDVELVTRSRGGPQYKYWHDLGFRTVYRRRMFARGRG